VRISVSGWATADEDVTRSIAALVEAASAGPQETSQGPAPV
jgi:hypothetical protein